MIVVTVGFVVRLAEAVTVTVLPGLLVVVVDEERLTGGVLVVTPVPECEMVTFGENDRRGVPVVVTVPRIVIVILEDGVDVLVLVAVPVCTVVEEAVLVVDIVLVPVVEEEADLVAVADLVPVVEAEAVLVALADLVCDVEEEADLLALAVLLRVDEAEADLLELAVLVAVTVTSPDSVRRGLRESTDDAVDVRETADDRDGEGDADDVLLSVFDPVDVTLELGDLLDAVDRVGVLVSRGVLVPTDEAVGVRVLAIERVPAKLPLGVMDWRAERVVVFDQLADMVGRILSATKIRPTVSIAYAPSEYTCGEKDARASVSISATRILGSKLAWGLSVITPYANQN